MNNTAALRGIRQRVTAGIGRVLLWSGGSLWIGRAAGRSQAHEHHAIQISLALSGRLGLRGDDKAEWLNYRGAIVWPHRRHEFDGGGESVAQVFVEPETAQGRTLMALQGAVPIQTLSDDKSALLVAPLRAAFASAATDASLIALGQHLVAQLCGGEDPPRTTDPRIARAIEFMRGRLSECVSLTEAASNAHLSPSRFRHLFMAQTGISFRAYLLWARIESAVGAAMGGQSWTEAAQDCGFADSAHLSRTCKRMFGFVPSAFISDRDDEQGTSS